MKKEIPIDIAGQSITIRSDEGENYVRALAAIVDAKMHEASRGQKSVTTLNLALTAALMIADDLEKLRSAQGDVDGILERLSGEIEASLDRPEG